MLRNGRSDRYDDVTVSSPWLGNGDKEPFRIWTGLNNHRFPLLLSAGHGGGPEVYKKYESRGREIFCPGHPTRRGSPNLVPNSDHVTEKPGRSSTPTSLSNRTQRAIRKKITWSLSPKLKLRFWQPGTERISLKAFQISSRRGCITKACGLDTRGQMG